MNGEGFHRNTLKWTNSSFSDGLMMGQSCKLRWEYKIRSEKNTLVVFNYVKHHYIPTRNISLLSDLVLFWDQSFRPKFLAEKVFRIENFKLEILRPNYLQPIPNSTESLIGPNFFRPIFLIKSFLHRTLNIQGLVKCEQHGYWGRGSWSEGHMVIWAGYIQRGLCWTGTNDGYPIEIYIITFHQQEKPQVEYGQKQLERTNVGI